MLKLAKVKSCQYFCNISRKKGEMKLIFCMQFSIKLTYKLVLSILVSMISHSQISNKKKKKIAKSLQYLMIGQVHWLSCVMGIIFICHPMTFTNDCFHLKNEERERGSSNNNLLIKLKNKV